MMGYCVGVKENAKTNQVTGEKGVVKKEQSMVSPGGTFPEGERIIKVTRKCVNFFSKSL